MTNEQVRDGFNEVYNQFWNKYKNNIPEKDSNECERMFEWVKVLRKKHPFLADVVVDLFMELHERGKNENL